MITIRQYAYDWKISLKGEVWAMNKKELQNELTLILNQGFSVSLRKWETIDGKYIIKFDPQEITVADYDEVKLITEEILNHKLKYGQIAQQIKKLEAEQ